MIIVAQNITWKNRVFFKLLSLNHDVYYFAYDGNGVSLNRFRQLDLSGSFTLDEWFDLNADFIKKIKNELNGCKIDSALQRKIISQEKITQLNEAVRRQFTATPFVLVMYSSGISRWLSGKKLSAISFAWALLAWAEKRVTWFEQTLRELKSLLWPSKNARQVFSKNFKTLWMGVSPGEYPVAEDSIRFDFLDFERKAGNENLYVLPTVPAQASRDLLEKSKTNWMKVSAAAFELNEVRRFGLAIGMFFVFIKYFFGLAKNEFSFEADLIKPMWKSILTSLEVKTVLSSISAAWPEHVVVEAANELNLKTVLWHYGINNFTFFRLPKQSRTSLFPFQIASVSKTHFVWNESSKEHFETIRMNSDTRSQIVGPVMSGNSKIMKPVRTMQDHQINVGVFDVPTLKKEIAIRYGFGPAMVPVNELEAFFCGIRELALKFPYIRLILKLKKSLNDPSREFPASLEALVSDSSFKNRLLILDNQSNPYAALALSDVCIGVPFTSPIAAAIHFKKPAYFFDATSRIRQAFPVEYEKITLHGKEELFDVFEKNSWKNAFPHKELQKVSGPLGTDPLQNMLQALRG